MHLFNCDLDFINVVVQRQSRFTLWSSSPTAL